MAGLGTADLAAMRTKVKSWADRSDLGDSTVDDFINIAVQKTNRKLLVPGIEAEATITLVSDDVPLPSDYLVTKELTVTLAGIVQVLEPKSIHFVEEVASLSTINPKFYARKLTNLILAPSPSGITSADLYYYKELATLSADSDTNWYITNASTVILYGALKELGVFISDEEYAASWLGQWQNELDEAKNLYDGAEWNGDTLAILP